MRQRETGDQPTFARRSHESGQLYKEVRSIQLRAAEHGGRIVSIGRLVFFSIDTSDTWILESVDHLATKLEAHEDALPVYIE